MQVKKNIIDLAKSLRTAPMFIADFWGVSPVLVERLLQSRNEIAPDESIYDAVSRHYGAKVADKCSELIDEIPFENTSSTAPSGGGHGRRNPEVKRADSHRQLERTACDETRNPKTSTRCTTSGAKGTGTWET